MDLLINYYDYYYIIIIIIIMLVLLRTLPNIQDLLEPLQNAISHMLIPAITESKCQISWIGIF